MTQVPKARPVKMTVERVDLLHRSVIHYLTEIFYASTTVGSEDPLAKEAWDLLYDFFRGALESNRPENGIPYALFIKKWGPKAEEWFRRARVKIVIRGFDPKAFEGEGEEEHAETGDKG